MQTDTTIASGERKDAFLFTAPTIALVLFFLIVPAALTIGSGFFRNVSYLPEKFIAFDNYVRLFADAMFLTSAQFTLLFVSVSVALEMSAGLAFALLLNMALPGRGMLRTAMLIPWAIPVAVSGRIWELMFNFEYGLFNFLLLSAGIIDVPINWLGSPSSAFFSIVVSDVWKTAPFITVILLAGLSGIDRELYQQAAVDGAGMMQRFFTITLPLLRPAIVVALLFRTIDALRIFDVIYVLTGGGPGGTTTSLSLYAYNYYVSGDTGYGSAVSVVMFAAAAVIAAVYLSAGRFRETIQ